MGDRWKFQKKPTAFAAPITKNEPESRQRLFPGQCRNRSNLDAPRNSQNLPGFPPH